MGNPPPVKAEQHRYNIINLPDAKTADKTVLRSISGTATGLTPEEKITLFLRFFRGREDVYPKLWQNHKSGKKGYSPACANEWVRGVCEKPRVKCGDCRNQAFLLVSSDVILAQLQGRHVIGVYPMLALPGIPYSLILLTFPGLGR